MKPESLKYRPVGNNKAERSESIVRHNLEILENFLVNQKGKKYSEGILGVLAKSDLEDLTIARQRIVITYRTGNGSITQLPQHAPLPAGVFSQYRTDVIYKNKIDIRDAGGKLLPKDGKPQIFIRTAPYPGDLRASYEFELPPEKPIPVDEWDDVNYFLREQPQPQFSSPSQEHRITPERLIARDNSQPVPWEKLTSADRTFLRSIEEFNEKYRNVDNLEENFFKLVSSKVNIYESPERRPGALKRILNSIRRLLARDRNTE